MRPPYSCPAEVLQAAKDVERGAFQIADMMAALAQLAGRGGEVMDSLHFDESGRDGLAMIFDLIRAHAVDVGSHCATVTNSLERLDG